MVTPPGMDPNLPPEHPASTPIAHRASSLGTHTVQPHPEKSSIFKGVIKKISRVASSILLVPVIIAVAALAISKVLSRQSDDIGKPYGITASKIRAFAARYLLPDILGKALLGENAEHIVAIKAKFEAASSKPPNPNIQKAFNLIQNAILSKKQDIFSEALILLMNNNAEALVKEILPYCAEAGLITPERSNQLISSDSQEIIKTIYKDKNPYLTDSEIALLVKLNIFPHEIDSFKQNWEKIRDEFLTVLDEQCQAQIESVGNGEILRIGNTRGTEVASDFKMESELDMSQEEKFPVSSLVNKDFFASARSFDSYVTIGENTIHLESEEKAKELLLKIKTLAETITPDATNEEKYRIMNILLYYCTQHLKTGLTGIVKSITDAKLKEENTALAFASDKFEYTLSPVVKDGAVEQNKFKLTFKTTLTVRPQKVDNDNQALKEAAIQSLNNLELGPYFSLPIEAELEIDCSTDNPELKVEKLSYTRYH